MLQNAVLHFPLQTKPDSVSCSDFSHFVTNNLRSGNFIFGFTLDVNRHLSLKPNKIELKQFTWTLKVL
jgi:hypothetical protein